MKETDIRKYAQLMKELDLTGLEITENDQKVRLELFSIVLLKQNLDKMNLCMNKRHLD